MTPRALLDEVAEAGGRIELRGDRLKLTAPRPLSTDLVARIREAKPLLLAALAEPVGWHVRHRVALMRWGALHIANEAAQLAWGELRNRWHMSCGERVPRTICAGCRQSIGDAVALDLIDRNRVHIADGYDCLIRHGRRWRGAATQALAAMGLQPPAGVDSPA